jgi:hypothetical protein
MIVVRPPQVQETKAWPTPLQEMSTASSQALLQSSQLFAAIDASLATEEEVTAETLRKWKNKSKKINQKISFTIRAIWKELDRNRIEIEIIKMAAERDVLDERANLARVLERVRTYANVSDGAVDRALIATSSIHSLMNTLCSTPETSFHGAASLFDDVKLNRDSLDTVFRP